MAYGWIGYHVARSAARSANASAADANSAAREARTVLHRLEDVVARQSLVLQTLLTICEKKGMFTEPEFRELMNEIDLSDGRLDGKYTPQAQPSTCPACGKLNGGRAVACMYCGAELPDRAIL